MKFRVEFETDNAAFEGVNRAAEIRWILTNVMRKLSDGATEGRISDTNGNSVGEWGFDTTAAGSTMVEVTGFVAFDVRNGEVGDTYVDIVDAKREAEQNNEYDADIYAEEAGIPVADYIADQTAKGHWPIYEIRACGHDGALYDAGRMTQFGDTYYVPA